MLVEKMVIKDLKLKWVHGMCRGKPVYASSNKLLIPSYFFMKTCDVPRNNLLYHFEPKIKIGCCCSLPELGIIAVSEQKPNGAIYILSYPKMSKVSVLEQNYNEPYAALLFMGLEILLSLQIKNSYEVDLWKWPSKERVYCLSIPFLHSEVPIGNLLINPLWWYQAVMQCNERVVLLEVKQADDKYALEASSYFFSLDKEGRFELTIKTEHKDRKDFHADVINPLLENLAIQSICWVPENDILVATSKAILKVEHSSSTVYKLVDNKTGVSSMVMSKSGLFIGYKTGYVDIVTIVGHRWNLIETIKIEQPINHLFLSPTYEFLTLTTQKGSIFYSQINQGRVNFKILFRSEFGDEVGVSFLGPHAKLCATAKRNGFIHIFRAIDGRVLSTFQIDEEIVSMATSPLCYYIVVGTNVGFLYFIDVTDVQNAKIIHCERPYEISVDHLKFDNFGRFLISSAQNQPIKIWNGLPSSGFALLGSKTITTRVKDFAAFCRRQDDDTVLLILAESGLASDKETGNVLIKLKLPPDFGSDPKKYQIDIFGTLSGDALNFQKRRLEKACCKMDIHWSLGAVCYSSKVNKIYKYSIWSDFKNSKEEDVIPVKNISYIRVSPDQQWITLTDLFGCLCFLSSKEFMVTATSKYTAESVCKSFIDFSLASNHLICGRENGVILYFEWEDDSNISKPITPEWVIYCYSQFDSENNCLHAMEEAERLDLTLKFDEVCRNESFIMQELKEKLERWIFVLNFNLNEFLQEKESVSTFSSDIFNNDCLERLSLDNRRKLPVIAPEMQPIEERVKKSGEKNAIKILSSFYLGFVTQNYSTASIDRDIKQIQVMNSHSDIGIIKKSLPNWSFNKTVKMKCKEERLAIIIDLIKEIYGLKTEFNNEFENLLKIKPNISTRSEEEILGAKQLTRNLPSKAERDFWGAVLAERHYGSHFENIESKDKSEGNQASDVKDDSIKEAKQSIDVLIASSLKTQEKFDSDVEVLVLKKRYCDCKIYKNEVKIHCILLFTAQEDHFSNWREEVEDEIKHLERLRNDILGLLKELSDQEKNVKDFYLELEKEERNKSHKIDAKCLKMDNAKARFILKKQPTLQLGDASQNPFWCPSSPIQEDLRWISKILFPNPFTNENYKTGWTALCNKQIQVLKLGVVIRNLQNQLIEITSVKQSCLEADLDLKINQDIMQKALKDLALMISNCSLTFQSLLTNQLENMVDLKPEGDHKNKTELSNWCSVDTSDPKIWKNIELEANRIGRIQKLLEEIGTIFQHLNELKLEMCSKSKCIRAENVDKMKYLKDELELKKQIFVKTKGAAEEIKGNRKSVFETLKFPTLKRNSGTNKGKS